MTENRKEIQHRYYIKHKEQIALKNAEKWRQDHPIARPTYTKEELKERSKECHKKWREENKSYASEYYRKSHPIITKKPQTKEECKEQKRKYYHAHKQEIRQKQKDNWCKNKELYAITRKEYVLKNAEKIKERARIKYKENPDRLKTYSKLNRSKINSRKLTAYHNNIAYRIECICRARLHSALNGTSKHLSTVKLLGCSAKDLCIYIESKWATGMSWDNYGLRGWHIDHIRPCASFDPTDPEQQEACFHYTNLQPLWAKDNLSKKDKWEPGIPN